MGQLVVGDVTGDDCVNLSDLWALAMGWMRRADWRVDLDGDGVSDMRDAALVWGNLGRCGNVVLAPATGGL
jgi:hypothetical protein